MTKYTVVWLRDAEDELGRIWMDAANRRAVASAANLIDDELRTDPDLVGAHVKGTFRTLEYSPLEIIFDVRTEDRLVRVLWVRQT
ncbi:MAG: hypothetical protein WD065_01575 [Planctomycetaceae bacterium]